MEKPDQNKSLPWTGLDWAAILLLGLGVVLAIARFWRPGIASRYDMLMAIYRLFELDQAWHQWVLYPRLGESLNFTYGAPLFQFYPPLVSYGALVGRWAGLGWIEATKAMFTLGLALAGWGTYVYGRWLFLDRRVGLVAGAACLFAPYLLTNVYERGAAAEALALGLLPWVFWTLHRALEQPGGARVALGGVLVALLVLAHNVTALFVLPAVLIYLLLLAWRQRRMRQLFSVAAASALGLGLSAFYWMPAIGEAGHTQMATTMLSGHFSAVQNLVPLSDLVAGGLVVDYWGPNRFHLVLWQALVLGLAACAIAFQAARYRIVLVLLLGMAALALAVQLTCSRVFWETVPLVRFIQFPWRLLGLVSFCAALLTGSLFLLRPLRGNLGTTVAVALLGVVMLSGLLRLRPDLSPRWSQLTDEQITQLDLFKRGRAGFALFTDYTPSELRVPSRELSLPRSAGVPETAPLPAKPEARVLSEGSTRIRLQVASDAAMPLRLHRIYFPGWQAYVDGRPVPTGPSGIVGLVTATIPAGNHQVDFRFGSTALRSVAVAISMVSLAVLVWMVFRSRYRKPVLLAFAGIASILAVLLFLHQGRGEPAKRPMTYAVDFQDEVSLLGYYLPRTTWKPGETVPVRLYWLAHKTLPADYKVFLHLTRLDDGEKVAQADSFPVLGYSPTTWWEPGEVVVDQQQISLGAEVPPGRYRLVMGLYRPDTMQNLAILQAPQTLPDARVVLSEIQVTDDM